MAVLETSDIVMPKERAAGLWRKAISGSVVAQLSGAEPMKFGETDIFTFDQEPRAEYVGESAEKSSSSVGFGLKTVKPNKVQVTLRFSDEVKWADEDHQMEVFSTCADACGTALGRALDLGVLHRMNPLTGTTAASILAANVVGTTSNVTSVTSDPDIDFETAAGKVIEVGYTPNGVAFDPKFAWTLATARYDDGRKKFPELGLGISVSNFMGINASTGTTVSGVPEVADTGFRAVIGDWSLLRWGVQRRVPIKLIEFGDPDGQGDLQRKNQIALRTEVVFGWAVMDLDGFSVLEDDSSSS